MRFRYVGWLALKILGATVLTAVVGWVLRFSLERLDVLGWKSSLVGKNFDAILFGFWIVPMIWVALVTLAVRDQRFRCRICARRLRMPLTEGSYGNLMLDHPGTEYVCPYGHGKLRIEVWSAGRQSPDWKAYDEFWEEMLRR